MAPPAIATPTTDDGKNHPRFLADPDEATYWQRVKKTWNMLDVRAAFANDAEIQAAKRIVWSTSTRHNKLL
jgi:hypothetical protein